MEKEILSEEEVNNFANEVYMYCEIHKIKQGLVKVSRETEEEIKIVIDPSVEEHHKQAIEQMAKEFGEVSEH